MEQEIKNILEKYVGNADYHNEIKKIKSIIDLEDKKYNEIANNKKINDNLELFYKKNKLSSNKIHILKQLKVSKNIKNSNDDMVGQYVDAIYAYDIYIDNKCYAFCLHVCGEKSDCNLNFYYKNYDNSDAIVNLYEDIKKMITKKININIFMHYVLNILSNDYKHEIFCYCFDDYELAYKKYRKLNNNKNNKIQSKIIRDLQILFN